MKKLNNKGWGLITLIGFICVFAIFLLVVAFLVGNFNNGTDVPNKDSYINYIFK